MNHDHAETYVVFAVVLTVIGMIGTAVWAISRMVTIADGLKSSILELKDSIKILASVQGHHGERLAGLEATVNQDHNRG